MASHRQTHRGPGFPPTTAACWVSLCCRRRTFGRSGGKTPVSLSSITTVMAGWRRLYPASAPGSGLERCRGVVVAACLGGRGDRSRRRADSPAHRTGVACSSQQWRFRAYWSRYTVAAECLGCWPRRPRRALQRNPVDETIDTARRWGRLHGRRSSAWDTPPVGDRHQSGDLGSRRRLLQWSPVRGQNTARGWVTDRYRRVKRIQCLGRRACRRWPRVRRALGRPPLDDASGTDLTAGTYLDQPDHEQPKPLGGRHDHRPKLGPSPRSTTRPFPPTQPWRT